MIFYPRNKFLVNCKESHSINIYIECRNLYKQLSLEVIQDNIIADMENVFFQASNDLKFLKIIGLYQFS